MTEAERAAALADEIAKAAKGDFDRDDYRTVVKVAAALKLMGACDLVVSALRIYASRTHASFNVRERVKTEIFDVTCVALPNHPSQFPEVDNPEEVADAVLSVIRPGDKLPGGLVVVPEEPTEPMCVAGCAEDDVLGRLVDWRGPNCTTRETVSRVYRAMLAAVKGAGAEPEQPTWEDWWTTPHERLDGKRPCDDPAGALELLAAIVHGLPA